MNENINKGEDNFPIENLQNAAEVHNKFYSGERQLYEFVKASEELPVKRGKYWIRYKHHTVIQYSGSFFDGWKFPHHNEIEWLKPYKQDIKPIDESLISYKNPEAIEKFKKSIKPIEPLEKIETLRDCLYEYMRYYHKYFKNGNPYPGFSGNVDAECVEDFIEDMKYQPFLKPIEREEIERMAEENWQIKAVIIHFATLDKMPTLELLDREKAISHVVTIAKNILEKYPPKSASLNKQDQ